MAKKQRNKQISPENANGEAVYIREEYEESAPLQAVIPKVDFDVWYAMRGSKIPPQHHKEIIKADFKGRGLSQYENLQDFDAALGKYGVNLG